MVDLKRKLARLRKTLTREEEEVSLEEKAIRGKLDARRESILDAEEEIMYMEYGLEEQEYRSSGFLEVESSDEYGSLVELDCRGRIAHDEEGCVARYLGRQVKSGINAAYSDRRTLESRVSLRKALEALCEEHGADAYVANYESNAAFVMCFSPEVRTVYCGNVEFTVAEEKPEIRRWFTIDLYKKDS